MAAGIAAPALAQQEPPRIARETLDCAEKIFGVDFSEQEEQAALNGVNNNLQNYERLRALDIPLDTEPAVTFRPYLPGKKPKPGATPGAKIKVALQAPPRATHQSKTWHSSRSPRSRHSCSAATSPLPNSPACISSA